MSSSIKETGLCDFLVLGEFYYMALSFFFERVCLLSRVNIWSSVSEFTTRGHDEHTDNTTRHAWAWKDAGQQVTDVCSALI